MDSFSFAAVSREVLQSNGKSAVGMPTNMATA
jgi:hypothetical protein